MKGIYINEEETYNTGTHKTQRHPPLHDTNFYKNLNINEKNLATIHSDKKRNAGSVGGYNTATDCNIGITRSSKIENETQTSKFEAYS